MAKIGQIERKKNKLVNVIPLKTPYTVMISPTDFCNLNCIFCEYHSPDAKFFKEQNNMSFSLFKMIIDQLLEFPDKVKLLTLDDYGEPTLNKELPKMIAYAKEKDVAERIMLVTNGTLLNPQLNKAIVEAGLDEIKISVEAIDERKFQKITSFKINMDRFISNIRDLYENKNNLYVFIKTVDIALEGKADEQRFYSIFNPISDSMDIEHIIPHSTHPEEIQLQTMGIPTFSDTTISGKKAKDKSICPHLMYYLAITPSGDVYPCSNGKRSRYFLGNVEKEELTKIWKSPYLRKLRIANIIGEQKNVGKCLECQFLRYTIDDDLEEDREEMLKKFL